MNAITALVRHFNELLTIARGVTWWRPITSRKALFDGTNVLGLTLALTRVHSGNRAEGKLERSLRQVETISPPPNHEHDDMIKNHRLGRRQSRAFLKRTKLDHVGRRLFVNRIPRNISGLTLSPSRVHSGNRAEGKLALSLRASRNDLATTQSQP